MTIAAIRQMSFLLLSGLTQISGVPALGTISATEAQRTRRFATETFGQAWLTTASTITVGTIPCGLLA